MPTIKIGSQLIYFDEYGNGESVILIPGLGANRHSWTKQILPFSKNYHVINLDNRDSGNSGQCDCSYNLNDMTNDIAGIIEKLKLNSVYVVGISMGSYIAQYLTLHFSKYVKKMVLVSSSAGGATHVFPKPEIFSLLNQSPDDDVKIRTKRLFTLITGPGFAEKHPEDIDLLVENALKLPMAHEAYMRQLSAAKTHNSGGTRENLSKIAVPTLVIHGECDPIMPYANGQVLSREIHGAKFLSLPDVGHLPHIEATETFNQTVLDFLQEKD